MRRTFTDYLQDILENCDKAAGFVAGTDFNQFRSNPEKVYAVVRALEIIGEAARHLPKGLKEKYPNIPWSKATGMRDRVIHAYFGIDVEVIWKTVNQDLPPLNL